MKKMTSILAAILVALMAICSVGLAETDPLHEHLDKLSETKYTMSTLEYGEVDPGQFDATLFVELIQEMQIEPADITEAPDGEYVVLTFPDEGIRFDFFFAEPENNYFRLVAADESETLYHAIVPEDRADIVGVMAAWYYSIASEQGLMPDVLADMPEEGWVLDSINGQIWMDDRASLEVFLEDEDNYKVLISWGSSAFETTEWVYTCFYDPDTITLNATHMECEDVVYGEDNSETRTTTKDQDVETVFALGEDGKLVMTNAGDEQLEGKTFERVPME